MRCLELGMELKIEKKMQKLLVMVFFTICIILILLIVLSQKVNAGDVSGNITSDTTWRFEESPYNVTGDLIVNEGVNLTIEPGVVVKFIDHYDFKVFG